MRRAFLHTFVVFLYLLSVLSSYATEFYFFFDIVSLNSLLFDWTRFDTRDHLSTFFLSSELLQNKDRKAHITKSTKTRKALESSITVCVFRGGLWREEDAGRTQARCFSKDHHHHHLSIWLGYKYPRIESNRILWVEITWWSRERTARGRRSRRNGAKF